MVKYAELFFISLGLEWKKLLCFPNKTWKKSEEGSASFGQKTFGQLTFWLWYFCEAKDFGHKRDKILLKPKVYDQENLHLIP